jgi:hypothetical protein
MAPPYHAAMMEVSDWRCCVRFLQFYNTYMHTSTHTKQYGIILAQESKSVGGSHFHD